MFLPHMLLHQYLLCTLTTVDTDLLVLHRMELYVHGSWRWEEGAMPVQQSPSLCFNSHSMDVTYVTSSGSVIAASGHSSNGVNVVIWETLAPPTASRASIISHEGIFLVLFPSKTLKHGKSDGCFDSCRQVSRDIQ